MMICVPLLKLLILSQTGKLMLLFQNEAWLENAIERKKKKFEKYDISDDEKINLLILQRNTCPKEWIIIQGL